MGLIDKSTQWKYSGKKQGISGMLLAVEHKVSWANTIWNGKSRAAAQTWGYTTPAHRLAHSEPA